MKNDTSPTLLWSLVLATSVTGCFFGPVRPGHAPANGTANASVQANVDASATGTPIDPATGEPVDGATTEPVDGTDGAGAGEPTTTPGEGAGDATSTPGAGTDPGLGGHLDTTALCTKASTCTTRVSMELCGMFNPKCLDGFHKHLDGATREGCQQKLDRLPGLVETWGRPGYALPAECR